MKFAGRCGNVFGISMIFALLASGLFLNAVFAAGNNFTEVTEQDSKNPQGLADLISAAIEDFVSGTTADPNSGQATGEGNPKNASSDSAQFQSPLWAQGKPNSIRDFVPPEREESYFQKKKLESAKKCFGCVGGFADISESALSKFAQKISSKKIAAEKDSSLAERKISGGISKSSDEMASVLVGAADADFLQETAALVKSLGGELKFAGTIGNVVSAELPQSAAYALANYPEVKYISKDEEFSALLLDSVPQIGANFPAGTGYSGYGVRVGVIDTGIEKSNSMLLGKVSAEADFSGDGTPNDLHGHGTHIAGIISGSTLNAGALNGVAQGSAIINAKALDRWGTGTMSSIIAAINFAINPDNNNYTDDGARVINMSFGAIGDFNGSPLESAIRDAEALGVIVVASAGNCGSQSPSSACNGYVGLTFPGSSPGAITVGSVDENNAMAGFSSRGFVEGYGPKPDMVAPGKNVVSSWPGNSLSSQSGTSMSAAFVSGTLALMLEKNPLLSPADARHILAQSAKDLGISGQDDLYGFGLVDANAALAGIENIESRTIAVTGSPTLATIGIDSNAFEARLPIFNNSQENAVFRGHVSEPWLQVAYPAQIPASSSSYILISADQKNLGVGDHNSGILLAVNDFILSHEVALTVVPGGAGQTVGGNFNMEISRPVSVLIDGVDPNGKIGRGKTVALKAKFTNPTFDGSNYDASLIVTGPSSYSCNLAWKEYYQPINAGKEVSFSYTVPISAPLGYYSVKSNSWLSCTGQGYDGACHPNNSYSCQTPPFLSEYTEQNLFQVVAGCTLGVCCNTTYNTFKPSTIVCNAQKDFEYGCPQGNGKGSDVYIRYLKQNCPGNASSCSGSESFGDWQLLQACDFSKKCDANAGACVSDPVTCYNDNDCGASGWIAQPFCSGDKNVMQDYITNKCNSPGTLQSSCSSNTAPKLKAACTTGKECSDGACVVKGSDECRPDQVGTSRCDVQTGTVQTCYFNAQTLSYKNRYETCGLGVCTDNNAGVAYCDNSQSQFSLGVGQSGSGIPVYKQPRDKVKVAIISRLGVPQSVLLLFDPAAFIPSNPDCASGATKVLSPGANYCDYNISASATRKPYPFTVSKGNAWASRTINVVLPQTIIVTDSEKLRSRFPNDYWRVSGLMQKLYQKAFENQGVVYDLPEYGDEIGVAPPFASFDTYRETLGSPTISAVNDYVAAVSSFVKRRCPIQYCKHVLIVGDDFVVPMSRSDSENFNYQTGTWKKEIIFSDNPYVPSTNKVLGDTNEFFSKYSSVAVVVPIPMDENMRVSVNQLKQTIKQKYGVADFSLQEYNANQISCNFYSGHPLQGKTVVLIGTPATNQAMGCLRHIGSPNSTFSVESSPWSAIGSEKKYALIIDTNSATAVQLTGMALENGLIRGKDYSNAELFDDALDTCGMVGFIPGIDVVGDVCTVGKDCGHFLSALSGFERDDGQGMWCSIGGGIAIIIPGFSVKWAKIAAKYMDNFHFARAVGSMNPSWVEGIFERFGKNKLLKGGEEEAAQLTIKSAGRGIIHSGDTLAEDNLGRLIFENKKAGLGNIIEEESENKIVKAFASKDNSITKTMNGQALEKPVENFTFMTTERKTHIVNRHFNGSIAVGDTEVTTFFPTGQTININGKTKTLENKMTLENLDELTEETLKESPILSDSLIYRKQVNKYGIRTMEVIVNKNNGKILTAHPIDGEAIWRWDRDSQDFVFMGG